MSRLWQTGLGPAGFAVRRGMRTAIPVVPGQHHEPAEPPCTNTSQPFGRGGRQARARATAPAGTASSSMGGTPPGRTRTVRDQAADGLRADPSGDPLQRPRRRVTHAVGCGAAGALGSSGSARDCSIIAAIEPGFDPARSPARAASAALGGHVKAGSWSGLKGFTGWFGSMRFVRVVAFASRGVSGALRPNWSRRVLMMLVWSNGERPAGGRKIVPGWMEGWIKRAGTRTPSPE